MQGSQRSVHEVGRRLGIAARKRPNCGLPPQAFQIMIPPSASSESGVGIDLNSINLQNYPDEGQISLNDLYDDPFVHGQKHSQSYSVYSIPHYDYGILNIKQYY